MGHYDALKLACSLVRKGLPHSLEFGVGAGRSIQIIRKRVRGEVFGFDSFEGLPADWVTSDGLAVLEKGFFATGGVPPEVEDVVFYRGLFRDTIPYYREIAKPVGLLHVDCDLYESTLDVLDGVGSLLREGSIIVFDEWWYSPPGEQRQWCDHEARAFLEWVKGRAFEFVECKAREARIVRMLG